MAGGDTGLEALVGIMDSAFRLLSCLAASDFVTLLALGALFDTGRTEGFAMGAFRVSGVAVRELSREMGLESRF